MSKCSNLAAVRNDMKDILEGRQKNEGGRVSLSCNLIPFLDTPIVHKWSDGGTEYIDDFVVRDFITRKPKTEKGETHKTLQGHRRNAILSQVFGYDETAFDNGPVKAALDKALPAAIALQHFYCKGDSKLQLHLGYLPGDVEGRKRVFMGVPAGDMFDLIVVDAEGKETLTAMGKRALDKAAGPFMENKHRAAKDNGELRQFILERPLVTSGVMHEMYGVKTLTAVKFLDRLQERAISEGVLPVPPPRNTERKNGTPTSLSEAVTFIYKQLESFLTIDEAEEPLSLDMERKLDELAERWASYRILNPRGALED